MIYEIQVANGSEVTSFVVKEVDNLLVESGVYTLHSDEGKVLFTSPTDSVLFISAV